MQIDHVHKIKTTYTSNWVNETETKYAINQQHYVVIPVKTRPMVLSKAQHRKCIELYYNQLK